MVLDKGLLLKGLAGVAAVGSVGGVGGVVIKNKLDERAAEEDKKKQELEGKKNAKKQEVNGKLKTLGIEGCDLEDKDVTSPTVFSKDCELEEAKFKKINFSNKGDQEVNVDGWTAGNKVTLNISNKPGEENGIKFLFKEVKDDLTITGDNTKGTITIKKQKATEFEEIDSKLSKKVNAELSQKLKTYNTKLGTLSLPASCRFDDTEDEKKLECEIKESELKTIKFSNKGDNNPLTLKGITNTDKIKLIIERTGESESLKYKFKNETSSNVTLLGTTGEQKKMVLKAGTEREFEEKDEKLSKIISDQATSTKLKEHNKNLEKLSLPNGCIFDITEEDASIECEISETEFKKIKFFNKADDSTELTVAGWNGQGNIKLKVERINGGDGNETLKYLFKDIKNGLTITGKNSESFKLKQNAEAEFEFREDVLGRPRKIEEIAKLVGLKCTYTTGSKGNSGTCTLEDNKNQISVSSDGSNAPSISFADGSDHADKKSQVSFDFSEYEYDYESNVKFTYKGETLETTVTNGKLENGASYGVREVNKGLTYWLVKKTSK